MFRRRRRIRDGDSYTILEENDIELEIPDPNPDPPPLDLQGEPMGWKKPGPKPRGIAILITNPKYQNRDDPGPFDGRWERDDDGS